MGDLLKFTAVLALLGFLIMLQTSRLLSLGGINPNLIFVFFSGLLLAPAFRKRVKFGFLSALLAFILILSFVISGFWAVSWIILAAFVFLIRFLRNFLTGRPFPDFLLVLGLGTPIFYGFLKIATGGIFAGGFVAWEVVYNLVLGVIFWLFLGLFYRYEK